MDVLLQLRFDIWRNAEVDYEVDLAKAVDIKTGHDDVHLIKLVLGILVIFLELIFLQLRVYVLCNYV